VVKSILNFGNSKNELKPRNNEEHRKKKIEFIQSIISEISFLESDDFEISYHSPLLTEDQKITESQASFYYEIFWTVITACISMTVLVKSIFIGVNTSIILIASIYVSDLVNFEIIHSFPY
jgi:hypothetical protein